MKTFLSILLISFSLAGAQSFTVKGKVTDAQTGKPLSFANMILAGTSKGTSSNIEGEYQIKLEKGRYFFAASYIGFKTDTVEINLNQNLELNFKLKKVSINLPEVTVLPKENPALEIIKRAIEAKHKRDKKLNTYSFTAYTKGLIKTTKDISTSGNSASIDIGEKDTAALKITGLLENQSVGYYKKPNNYKEKIIAQKQSSNFSSSINVLTGGRIVQSFYKDDIQFFDSPLLSPLADDALDYYYYYIEDTVAQDNQNIFQIYFTPDDESDPGFYGRLFIADGSFALLKIDTKLNDAANPGGIFTNVNVFQQFVVYQDNIYMPIDYRLFVEGNFLGIAKFGFEINSIMYDYEINNKISDDFFDKAVLTVSGDADKKDSLYWKGVQTIPNTKDEFAAYKRIDSLEAIPKNFWDEFSFLSDNVRLNENLSITGPMGLYSFNRVEEHRLNFGFAIGNFENKRFGVTADFGYGFSDKKIKSEIKTHYYFGDYRTNRIYFSAYNKINGLFDESIKYNDLTSTLFNLISKYDFRDYYYTKGFELDFKSEVTQILELGIGFVNRTDNSGFVNTDFSFFNKDKHYRINKPIYETKINAVKGSFSFDFRNFIEDGYFRRRISRENFLPTINGEILFSDKNTLNSNLDFKIYKINAEGEIKTFGSSKLSYEINGITSEGNVPYQMLYALAGNIESSGKNFSFRTLKIGEVFGDKVFTFGAEQNFGDRLFRFLQIPVIKDMQLQFGAHFNMALSDISKGSKSILYVTDYKIFKHPFYEAGFSIGHILFPLKLEFTWKLNYRGENNFVFGINTFAL
ncbi:MAG: hypothetical protein A2068_03255 [Ignavibacteria bacterium GWB2_35_6b]|nr:MAG: hypothetical protein A2068_03255 [Ignavibacteria bacterium GWB2_35_6b]